MPVSEPPHYSGSGHGPVAPESGAAKVWVQLGSQKRGVASPDCNQAMKSRESPALHRARTIQLRPLVTEVTGWTSSSSPRGLESGMRGALEIHMGKGTKGQEQGVSAGVDLPAARDQQCRWLCQGWAVLQPR